MGKKLALDLTALKPDTFDTVPYLKNTGPFFYSVFMQQIKQT